MDVRDRKTPYGTGLDHGGHAHARGSAPGSMKATQGQPGENTARRRVREQPFGEFLVRRRLLTRTQLLDVLMEQDRTPGVRFGELVGKMGLLAAERVDSLLGEYLLMPPLATFTR